MGLDFEYTCKIINKELSNIKKILNDNIEMCIKQLLPTMEKCKITELKDKLTSDLYDKIKPSIEHIRKTNQDIRKQSDFQIETLESEIQKLKSKQ